MSKETIAVEFSSEATEKNGPWKHLVKYCIESYEEIKASNYRKNKIAEIEASYKAYQQKPDKKKLPWKNASNIMLPLVTTTVDNLEPRLVAGKIDRKPMIMFVMEGMTDKDQATEILEDWFNNELSDRMAIEDRVRKMVHRQLLEGTIYAELTYARDEVLRRDFVFDQAGNFVIDPQTQQPAVEDKPSVEFEGVKSTMMEFTDVFVPDDGEDWETTPVLTIKRPTYAELKRMSADPALGYMNIGEWLLKDKTDKVKTEEAISPANKVDDIRVTAKEVVECLECYVNYIYRTEEEKEEDATDFTEERLVVTIAKDSQIVIRVKKLRDINFKNEKLIKRIRLYPEEGKAYGTCLYGKMKGLQHAADDLFNLMIDVATVIMCPWYYYGNKAGLPTEIEIWPGKGIPCDDPSQIEYPKFNIDLSAVLEGIRMVMGFWERLASIGDLQVGRTNEQKTTATETLAVIQEGNIKHNYQSKTAEQDFTGFFRTIYDLYYQYMSWQTTHVFKGQRINIPRREMARPYKFELSSSTELANKMIERKEAETIYTQTIQNPLIDPTKPTMKLLKSNQIIDAEEWIQPMIRQVIEAMQQNPEIPQVIQQHLQQKQQMQQIVAGRQELQQEKQKAETERAAGDAAQQEIQMQMSGGGPTAV